jgi:signal transduction histidine kinase
LRRLTSERSVLVAFGATILAMTLLAGWAREPGLAWLVATAMTLAAAAALLSVARRRSRVSAPPALIMAVIFLAVGLAAGLAFSWQFHRMERYWADVVATRQAVLGSGLQARMAGLVERGASSADSAAGLAASVRGVPLFRGLAGLRDRTGVDAVAVYTTTGDLVAWAGEHRGPLPDSVWLRGGAAYFEERPLFSYLYFSRPVPGRGEHAVVAVLVETGIIGEGRDGASAAVVAAQTGTRAGFRRGGGADAVWALAEGADTVVHARLEPVTQGEWRRSVERQARRAVMLAVLGALLAAGFAWVRWVAGRARGRGPAAALPALPLVLALVLAGLAPLRDVVGADRLFSPLLFTLPMPGDVSLGRVLVLLLPVVLLAAGIRRRPGPRHRLPFRLAAGAFAMAVAYPAVVKILLDGATPALLHDPAPLWLGLQLAGVVALATATVLLLPQPTAEGAGGRWSRPLVRRVLLAVALVTSAGLGFAVAGSAGPDTAVPAAVAALWAVPYVLAGLALALMPAAPAGALAWLVGGWLATTAVLPPLWSAHVGARIAAAESEVETLGARADPYLDYLLVSFSREAMARFAAGEEGVQLLYRTWVASGLAREPYPARIVLWSPLGLPEVQLGSAPVLLEGEADRLTAMVGEASQHALPITTQFTDLPNVSKLLTVPLQDGSLITVVVPPRRSFDRTSAVAPFLGVVAESPIRLNLVEAPGPSPGAEGVAWTESPDGWRGDAVVQYPDGWHHAHVVVPVAGMGIRVVRAALLLTFNLGLLSLLWLVGVLFRGRPAVPRSVWRGWLGSFRARVTVALFAFFLVPTAVFGWAAYSALAGEVARAAERVAQHSVNQAVIEFDDAGGDLRRLALHAGTDVLRYHGGELIDVSSREALDLGVYSAWLPPHVYLRLESGEERDAIETQTLGAHSFVTAYRAMRPAGILGVPMSLSAGDAAVRLRELAHIVLFAAVVGALLSLALSVAVGRALARPIGRLRRAAAAVGSGSLRVRLPERTSDEFGQLFGSFNRMTRRLRRARARELRTARVLAWGEMARQVAHEIKNPLTPIKLSVQHLRRAHTDGHPDFDRILDSSVSQILVEIDRLSEIARAFSRYGAPGFAAGPLAAVDAPWVIREALTLYRSGDRDVEYVDSVEPGLPRVRARPDELKEVILNLVENSRAALDGAGRIVVSGSSRNDHVEIEVTDDGPGIAQELLPRVFEPHFSTRSAGTGLGLAIVRRLVESWGGTVTAESEPGKGTTIRLRLAAAAPDFTDGA